MHVKTCNTDFPSDWQGIWIMMKMLCEFCSFEFVIPRCLNFRSVTKIQTHYHITFRDKQIDTRYCRDYSVNSSPLEEDYIVCNYLYKNRCNGVFAFLSQDEFVTFESFSILEILKVSRRVSWHFCSVGSCIYCSVVIWQLYKILYCTLRSKQIETWPVKFHNFSSYIYQKNN